MDDPTFFAVLRGTGYVDDQRDPCPGMILRPTSAPDWSVDYRLAPLFHNPAVGLLADGVYSSGGAITHLFKDATASLPGAEETQRWHEAAWNLGLAPLLWVVTRNKVELRNCFSLPDRAKRPGTLVRTFGVDRGSINKLNATFGRCATDAGLLWTTPLASDIHRAHRVDRQLLNELKALQRDLVQPHLRPGITSKEIEELFDFAQSLIGRCIFVQYLLDRHLVPGDLLESEIGSGILIEILGDTQRTLDLFRWLKRTFNGDLFPFEREEWERERLSEDYLQPLRDFFGNVWLSTPLRGQHRMFRFRWNAIPIHLISAIYEQFATRTATPAAAQKALSQSLHYTPIELVDLVLDTVFANLDSTARILDPTCGSAIFLVESLRRLLAMRRREGTQLTHDVVRSVIKHQLRGIDVNLAAIHVAAFSLYLAALDLAEEAIEKPDDLKFDHLIGSVLLHADALTFKESHVVGGHSFDAVIGNPPWSFSTKAELAKKKSTKKNGKENPTPARSPDQEFLRRALEWGKPNCRVGMVLKASPIFSRAPAAVMSRTELLQAFAPAALINLSEFRKRGLFEAAAGPALIFFGRCTSDRDIVTIGRIPWTQAFSRSGRFEVGFEDLSPVSLTRVKRIDGLVKAYGTGLRRDASLVERLFTDFHSLRGLLDRIGIPEERRGQGYQVGTPREESGRRDERKIVPDDFLELPVLSPDDYWPILLDISQLSKLDHGRLHRVRSREIYRGPMVIYPEGRVKRALQVGRYSAGVSMRDVMFSESFSGISFHGAGSEAALILAAVLNSSVCTHQLTFGYGGWGIERPKIETGDIMLVRVPALDRVDRLLQRELVDLAMTLDRTAPAASLEHLDSLVGDLYGLSRSERLVAHDALSRVRPMLDDAHGARELKKSCPDHVLRAYAATATEGINAWFVASGRRHFEVACYRVVPPPRTVGLVSVAFRIKPGRVKELREIPIARIDSVDDLMTRIGIELGRPFQTLDQRSMRVHGRNAIVIVKRDEVQNWCQTAALTDADLIIDDLTSNRAAA